MKKLFENPSVMGWVAVITLLLLALYIVDDRKNPKRNFFGLLKPSTPKE